MTPPPPDSGTSAPPRAPSAAARPAAPPHPPPSAADHDGWFVWRNLLGLWITLVIAVKVFLMRESTMMNFSLPAGEETAFDTYVLARGLFVLVICAVYLFSYLRDWHFRIVAWVFVFIPIVGMLLDWTRVWSFVLPESQHTVPGLIGLRLVVLACLIGNALNAHRAPPMPRSLWR